MTDGSTTTSDACYIVHVDGDNFFAACEVARLPQLNGKPVVVGEERGIACAMSYEAKHLGITRGMPIYKIRRQFPNVVILSSHFELYEHYANKLFSILKSRLDSVERYSIDECFGLVHFPPNHTKSHIEAWLRTIKHEVQTKTGIAYSFGLARTKTLAKIASKHHKPNGCAVVLRDDEHRALRQTPIASVWGIGERLSRRLHALRVETAYDFSLWDIGRVQRTFSLPVQQLWYELHGKKMFTVKSEFRLPKSLQSTKSFAPSTNKSFVIAELLQNIDIAFSRMRRHGLVTNSISFYMKTSQRHYDCVTHSLQWYCENSLDVTEAVAKAATCLYRTGVRYRATGVTLLGLRPKDSLVYDFFGSQTAATERATVTQTIDAIRKKFGYDSIGLFSALPSLRERSKNTAEKMRRDSFVSGLPLPYLGEVF